MRFAPVLFLVTHDLAQLYGANSLRRTRHTGKLGAARNSPAKLNREITQTPTTMEGRVRYPSALGNKGTRCWAVFRADMEIVALRRAKW